MSDFEHTIFHCETQQRTFRQVWKRLVTVLHNLEQGLKKNLKVGDALVREILQTSAADSERR